MQQGHYTAMVAPIGYIKDPRDKHKLIVEERGAELVRYIFHLPQAAWVQEKLHHG